MEPDEQNLALSQGLLGLGAGLLSGSFGHYGAMAPALGQGMQGFNQGYSNALNMGLHMKMFNQQKMLQDAQIKNYQSEEQKRNYDLQQQQASLANASGADDYATNKLGLAPPPPTPAQVMPTSTFDKGIFTRNAPRVFNDQKLPSPTSISENQVAQPDSTSKMMRPDWHLARAEFLLSKGDRKGADEALKQSMSLRNEERSLGKDERDKPLEGVPGITWNAGDGIYKEDGKPVTAARVQQIKEGLAKAGATRVETNISTEKKYGEQFAGKIAADDAVYRDTAIKAPELAQRANSVKQVLASGKVITGAGADSRLALGKALGLLGASDQETITNTETLATSLAQNTLDSIKASGLGGGNGFSNADRDFLEKAVGGKITLEAGTLNRLAELAHRAATKSAEKWNNRVKMIPDSALQGTGLTRDPVEVPPLYGPNKMGPKTMLSPSERSELDALRKRFNK